MHKQKQPQNRGEVPAGLKAENDRRPPGFAAPFGSSVRPEIVKKANKSRSKKDENNACVTLRIV
jgi:hypothetical protein